MRRLARSLSLMTALSLGAQEPSPEALLAAQVLALPDAAATEGWLEAHRAELTPELGRELEAQSRVLLHAGQYAQAMRGFVATVRVGEIADDSVSRIRGLHDQAETERIQGHVPEALALLERAMSEAEAASDRAAVARINGTLGLMRLTLGAYDDALAMFERQRAAFEALGDTKGRGQAENNLGIALGTIGRYEEAAEAFARSRELYEAAGYVSGIPRAYNNLGRAHFNLGNYGLALQELSHSLQLKEAAGKSSELPSSLKGIGEVHLAQGAPDRALEYFRRSFASAAAVGQKPEMADALQSEGQALLALGRPQDALAVLERGLSVAREAEEIGSIDAISLVLAEAHLALGARSVARELLQGTLASVEARNQLAGTAELLRVLAGVRLDDGAPAEALALAERAQARARQCGTPDELWPALLVGGRARAALGESPLAESDFRAAVEVIEALRQQTVGPDSDRAAFLVSRSAPYEELVNLLVQAGRTWDAFAVAERDKGRVLLDVLAGGRSSIAGALDGREREEEHALESALLTANSELRNALVQPQPDTQATARLEAERARRRLALEAFRARAYAAHPELRVLRGESPPLASGDLRALLEDGTVLLEFALTPRHAYVFALRADAQGEADLTVRRLDESEALVRRAHDLRERLARRDLDFAQPAASLYQGLLSPVKDVLRGARRVVIVPDGALWELPFQALRSPGGRYLVEQMPVAYAPSLSVLRDMRARAAARARSSAVLLAVGNPDLGPGARRAPAALMDEPLAPLPQAEEQVREIAQLYDRGASAVRLGSQAREAWLKSQAPNFRILHLATHGVLDDTSPLYSALVLAAPLAGERDDGLLEAREILGLDLHADVAVLSACETGRGKTGAGEGLIGTSWAFFVAGCSTTVASQWKVDAAGTTRLMVAFHRALRAGQAPAEALRTAAIAQLRRGSRHPFYWAGFVAVGDAYAAGPRPAGSSARPASSPR